MVEPPSCRLWGSGQSGREGMALAARWTRVGTCSPACPSLFVIIYIMRSGMMRPVGGWFEHYRGTWSPFSDLQLAEPSACASGRHPSHLQGESEPRGELRA